MIENYKNICGKKLKQERVIKAARDTSFCILLPPFTIPLFLTHRKDLVSLIYILVQRAPLSRSTLSIYYKYPPFSASLSSITFSLLRVLSYRAGSTVRKGKKIKEREEGQFSFLPVCELGLWYRYYNVGLQRRRSSYPWHQN